MPETWKPIPGFPGYEVSDHGRVRSFKRHGSGGIEDAPQRILKTAAHQGGYAFVCLSHDGTRHIKRNCQLVLLAFVGPCPDGMEVCHNDGNPQNDHLDNLRYDTHAGNMRDARKLCHSKIAQLRREKASGQPTETLARRYGIAISTAISICTGRLYSNAPGPLTRYNFSEPEIITIRERRAKGGELLHRLAAEYGTSESSMSKICSGDRYAHFGGPITNGRSAAQ